MSLTYGVVQFPGSNCESDVQEALGLVGIDSRILWHGDESVGDVDGLIIPGGFAYGDYLRAGAIARFSPVIAGVSAFAAAGGPVVGICNGFQVLTEAGLLPGALRKNEGLRFICDTVSLIVESKESVLTQSIDLKTELKLPINHFEGAYMCDNVTLTQLKENNQVILRYANNPNGSIDSIAGVSNEAGNVVGLMPHPERASSALLGSEDGLQMFKSLLS